MNFFLYGRVMRRKFNGMIPSFLKSFQKRARTKLQIKIITYTEEFMCRFIFIWEIAEMNRIDYGCCIFITLSFSPSPASSLSSIICLIQTIEYHHASTIVVSYFHDHSSPMIRINAILQYKLEKVKRI